MRTLLWFVSAALLSAGGVGAIGQDAYVSFKSTASQSASMFTIVNRGKAAPLFVSPDEWPGVQMAASNFVADIHKVTGVTAKIANATSSSSVKSSPPPIIIGTLGKSSLISEVVSHANLDVSSISGQWEAFMAKEVANPLPGVSSAYVIIGSDKRGTIFALYDHSEQMGVSPWYWWADVPTTQHADIFVSSSGISHGSPSVKYRGIFLNDEQPALQNWAMEKFTNGTGSALLNSPFNHLFYTKLFELMLRIKANYLWPAIWGSAFAVDDTLNQPLADLYGVVMGTSHQEPMMRSTPNEWNLFGTGPWNYTSNAQNVFNYWVNGTIRAKPFESLFTLGMRGDGDLPLSETTNIDLLEKVVADQRLILSDVFNGTDVTTIPQLWALYKEVQGYYEDGMRVPDDVTLLWTDDNWGNVRRFPIANERNRTGGAGVYYHYDYVGTPRDYKWITSSQISKTFEQMSIAVERQATTIWILNVGDLKPYELGTEFFITYGWDTSRWTHNNLDTFVTGWAQREFDLSIGDANTVAEIIGSLTRWNNRRKPELLNGTTYSLTNYREAETVQAGWANLTDASTKIYDKLSSAMKPAFFQMVHHPVLASSNLGNMWISQGLNNLRASQARLSANNLADLVETFFEQDWELEHQFHTLLDGKWDHMMEQTHVQYFYWQQPMANTMPAVSRVQPKKQVLAGPMRISPEGSLGTWPGDNPNQCSAGFNCPSPTLTLDPFVPLQQRYIDVGVGGPNSFTFTASANASWLKLSTTKGSVSSKTPELRVEASVDWSQVTGVQTAVINFNATTKNQPIQVTQVFFVANRTVLAPGFKGFVEGDGGISIEAAHASRNTSVAGVTWTEFPGLGKTLSAVSPWPRMANNGSNFTAGTGPSIEYDFFNFNTIMGSGNITVTTMVSPSLNANGEDRPLAFAVQVDSLAPQTKTFIPAAAPGQLPAGWDTNDGFVANSIVSVNTVFNVSPGAHTLKIWMIEPAVVVQKIVINTGNVRPSYLGPPESIRLV